MQARPFTIVIHVFHPAGLFLEKLKQGTRSTSNSCENELPSKGMADAPKHARQTLMGRRAACQWTT